MSFINYKKAIVILISLVTMTVGLVVYDRVRKVNKPDEISRRFENQNTIVAAHRVNIKEKLIELLKYGIKNIEVDVFINNNKLLIGHEESTASGLSLEEYLEEIKYLNYNFKFIWLDLKDLTLENEELVYRELNKLDKKFNLKDRVLIESKDINALKYFFENGWDTAYYLKYNLDEQDSEYFKNVINDLNSTGVSAITFDCKYIDLVKSKFISVNLKNSRKISFNCWTFQGKKYKYNDFEKLLGVDRLLISFPTKNNL